MALSRATAATGCRNKTMSNSPSVLFRSKARFSGFHILPRGVAKFVSKFPITFRTSQRNWLVPDFPTNFAIPRGKL